MIAAKHLPLHRRASRPRAQAAGTKEPFQIRIPPSVKRRFKAHANHDQPIEADDLPGLVGAFNSRDKMWAAWQARDAAKSWMENWWFADAAAIEREDWSLSASRYRPESREAAEHRDPRELLEELQEDVEAILGDIEALVAELDDQVV